MQNSTTDQPQPAPHNYTTDQDYWGPPTPTTLKREKRVSTASLSRVDTPTTLAPATKPSIPSFGSFISHNRPSSMFALSSTSETQTFQSNNDAPSRSTSLANQNTFASSPAGEVTSPAKPAAQIDPADGKTRTCDRAKTFETFVDGGKLDGDLGVAEAVGARGDVRRGLGRVRGWFGRGKREGKRDRGWTVI